MIIPRPWREALMKVQEEFPDATIAGGCLRDSYFNLPIKDIDIFIPNSTVEVSERLSKFVYANWSKIDSDGNQTKAQIKRHIQAKKYDNVKNPDVDDVITVKTDFGIDLEFITVECPKEGILDRFDYDICQISYDLNSFHIHDNFKKAVAKKTISLIRCDDQDQYDRSTGSRLDKLMNKLPDYSVDLGLYGQLYGGLHNMKIKLF